MPPPGVVFNRSDCPYGCGTSLPANLRWTRPCPGCGRTLHPVLPCWPDAGGRGPAGEEVWPTVDVPRLPDPLPPGSQVWYVITDDESAERARIIEELMRELGAGRSRRATGWRYGLLMVAAAILGIGLAISRLPARMLRRARPGG
jgi:hypothetical protein